MVFEAVVDWGDSVGPDALVEPHTAVVAGAGTVVSDAGTMAFGHH